MGLVGRSGFALGRCVVERKDFQAVSVDFGDRAPFSLNLQRT